MIMRRHGDGGIRKTSAIFPGFKGADWISIVNQMRVGA
ncbi:hypothetical protein CFter6_1399 [Collimonas fungivorans]|uniref:Uncharacterized protein n=1 Tax=Collimonas fungivorans TaxID=158899 RepID=A0A127P8G2_9BURK|nr:hypothetical protein CFter6_1399 [Collimonas fungivorans]